MNMLAVGVEGDIGAEELSGPPSDITFAFSLSISVLTALLRSDTLLTLPVLANNNLYFYLSYV